ncbi:unnamed protein product [marine sediment metagenome]|uniref:Uncharacterized protein n=1 Tax=marine sediment metagenome TaxID=412755 RepID=X1KTI2_9ZZZZ
MSRGIKVVGQQMDKATALNMLFAVNFVRLNLSGFNTNSGPVSRNGD